jgi:hypothetical protein
MNCITSEGFGWELVEEDGNLLLKLACPYGTVEIKVRGGEPMDMLLSAAQDYDRLKAMGPIETAVEA